jgi:hypothetical protein
MQAAAMVALPHAPAAAAPVCNCSAVTPNRIIGSSSISGKLPSPSLADCCAKCLAVDYCVAWVWSSDDKQCWLKDNTNGRRSEQGHTSGGCSGRSPQPPPSPSPPSPPPPPTTASIDIDLPFTNTVVGTTSEGYVSYTLDWWDPSQVR